MKMKTIPLNTMQAQRSGRGMDITLLHPEARRGWVVSATPWPL